MYTIYKITCKSNDRTYYGRSQEVVKRWRSHRNMLRKNSHSNSELQLDWNLFGEDAFVFEVIELCSDYQESLEKEQKLIDYTRGVSYNIANSTLGGDTFTHNPRREEIRELKSRIFSGEGNPMFGKEKSERMIASVKEANSKKVSINGIIYGSLTEASAALGVKISTVSYRLKAESDKYKTWIYVDEEMPNDYRNHA
ncbi:GIY-YIG nuclease family protein [Paenibacillus sp. ACRRY]|uniref:GIY-YIG nuclease family protein n=1 Tax=Paenibacillus sp. ACRRY TaxID=2918208 RepID=UPI001EF4CD97|nr:GIY-YIG nuclease family protein [Paenibacillus sp. ACRRY]